jgi:hypothetical protein
MITITCWILWIPCSRVSEATRPVQPAATSARHTKATGNRVRDVTDRTTTVPKVTRPFLDGFERGWIGVRRHPERDVAMV